jgi:hypothetical protein
MSSSSLQVLIVYSAPVCSVQSASLDDKMSSVNRNAVLSFGSKYIRHRKLAYAHPEEECTTLLSTESSEISCISEFLFVIRDTEKRCFAVKRLQHPTDRKLDATQNRSGSEPNANCLVFLSVA